MEAACRKAGVVGKRGGTYVCMEGPQFSTRAESNLYRSWGMDVIGMTNLQEAKLAREAEICYATAAMVTDYDCWHPAHDSVTVEQIVAVLQPERGQRLQRGPPRRGRHAAGAKLQVRLGATVRHPDRPAKDSRGDAPPPATDSRKISRPGDQRLMSSILAIGTVAFDSIKSSYGQVDKVSGRLRHLFRPRRQLFHKGSRRGRRG